MSSVTNMIVQPFLGRDGILVYKQVHSYNKKQYIFKFRNGVHSIYLLAQDMLPKSITFPTTFSEYEEGKEPFTVYPLNFFLRRINQVNQLCAEGNVTTKGIRKMYRGALQRLRKARRVMAHEQKRGNPDHNLSSSKRMWGAYYSSTVVRLIHHHAILQENEELEEGEIFNHTGIIL